MQTIVEARYVTLLPSADLHRRGAFIHSLSARTRSVEAMNEVLQFAGVVKAYCGALLWNLIANAPHHDGWVVAVYEYKVGDVTMPPRITLWCLLLCEKAGIAIFTFSSHPHIKRLCHYHHAHLITNIHLPRCWHIVRGSYSIAAHILE